MATVTKRKWVYKGQEKTAWIVRYSDGTGTRRMKTFELKKEADGYRIKVESQRAASDYSGKSPIENVRQLCAAFDTFNDRRKTEGRLGGSRHTQLGSISTRVAKVIGATKLSDLNGEHILSVYRAYVDDYGNAPATARDVVRRLRAIEKLGKTLGALPRGATPVADALDQLRDVKSPDRVESFSDEQVKAILATASDHRKGATWVHARMEIFCHLAAFCGMRWGEIAALTVSDVRLDALEIEVRRSLSTFDGLKTPKTKSSNRTLPLPSHIAAQIKAWLATHWRDNPEGLLFVSSTERLNPTDRGMWWRQWRRLLDRAGVAETHTHFHSLRHFAASRWLQSCEIGIADVSKLMGHSNAGVTLRVYSHALDSADTADRVRRMAQEMITAAA